MNYWVSYLLLPISNILLFGRLVHVITDHKPLVSLFRKSLVDLFPRLTRMLVQLLDFTLDVTYQPGTQMHLSDAITRLSSHDKNEGITIENLDISIHAIKELTGFNSLSVDKIRQHTTKDQTMQLLIQHINKGFPESSTKLPNSIKAYFSFRDELTVYNGMVLKGHNRIVIPESLRTQAVNILHNKAQLGLNKTLERMRTCMYWPGITNDIKDSISACKVCLMFSDKQQRELYSSDTVTRPWSHLSLDNFEFQGQHFLMILDVATKFSIVRMVSSLNTNLPYEPFLLCSLNKAYQLPLGVIEVEILFLTCSSSIANISASTLHFPALITIVRTLLRELSGQSKG